MSPDELRKRLQDHNLAAVAAAVGLSSQTIYRMMRGAVRPHKATLKAIEAYLTATEQATHGAHS